MQNCIKWLCIPTVNTLRVLLCSLALRSCSCCSSGRALCPPSSSPHPCMALLSADLAVWGATAVPPGPRCHPSVSFFATCMVPTPGAGEGLWKEQGTNMDEFARKQTTTGTGLVSFSHFATGLIFIFPFQAHGQESVTVSLQSASFPNCGWKLFGGCAGTSLSQGWGQCPQGRRSAWSEEHCSLLGSLGG